MIHRIARQARPLLIAAGMAILGLSAQAQTTLRVGFGLGLDAHYGLGAVQMQKLVAERMGGRFKLELFP
ncbi:MAG: hypothetical protein ACKO3Q_01725, partial [Betaproteobacteria bacterium]